MSELADPIIYSEVIEGTRGNYYWPVRFDKTTPGYVGITQYEDKEAKERVLLSPTQAEELVKFIQSHKRAHVKRPSKKRAK